MENGNAFYEWVIYREGRKSVLGCVNSPPRLEAASRNLHIT